ncbi:MAG: hypothetical protein ACE5HI_04675 [bacterium]
MLAKRKLFIVVAFAAVGVSAALVFYFNPSLLTFGGADRTVYSHPAFGVSFEYPAHWAPDPQGGAFDEIPLRFVGGDGYLGVDALAADSETSFEDLLNQIVIQNQNTPYGTRPVIKSTEIDGLEARVVLPSEDQPEEANNEAIFIARYPGQAQIGDDLFRFFVLYAHKDHLEDILRTLRFTFTEVEPEEASSE